MTRSSNLVSWCLVGLGVFAGCRLGYDEIPFIGDGFGGGGGTSGRGGSGTSGTQGDGGDAGDESTGGASVTGGEGGASASGGDAAAGDGGTSSPGGSGGTSASAGADGTGGAGGSASGTGGTGGAGGSASGTGGAGGSASGAGGAGGSASGAGGAGGSASGAGGAGGYAGASSLGDCQTLTQNAHDYVSCNVNVSWTAARDNCWSIGMDLIRIDDATENQWTHDNVYDTPPRNSVWIGGSDITIEGEWRWTDGALFWLGDFNGSPQNGLYSNFFPQHPSAQGPTRDCGALDLGSNPGWFSNDCAVALPYICESR